MYEAAEAALPEGSEEKPQVTVAVAGRLVANNESLGQLIDLMRSVMHKAPGVGLAAPQLGIPLQLAVLETPPLDEATGDRCRLRDTNRA